ncbi:exported hypothetical protein [Mesorhizobium sp. STM 4661]|nr:exported hypothetical protein [Mesorhizobium sp. STM 4661]
MRVHLSTAAAGFLLLAGIGAAAAQDVIIAPEQETVIKEYVKKQPLASVKVPGVELKYRLSTARHGRTSSGSRHQIQLRGGRQPNRCRRSRHAQDYQDHPINGRTFRRVERHGGMPVGRNESSCRTMSLERPRRSKSA